MALAENLNQPSPPVLSIVTDPDADVCGDCLGRLIIEDDDGSVSGTVGTLIDCGCVAMSVPPGFVECRACASLVPVPDPRLQEYLDWCTATGTEPAWCLRCGDYRPLSNTTRTPCQCAEGRRRAKDELGSSNVTPLWRHQA